MKKEKKLSESLEDYLEVILELENTMKVARAKDIAEKTGVQRGSVTSALKNLEEKKLINYAPYSFITLTDKGRKIAGEISLRHAVLKDFFIKILQIDEEAAESTACRMEHAVDKKTLERLIQFFDFIHQCPRTGKDWLQNFIRQCSSGLPGVEACRKCINSCKISNG